MGRSPPNTNPTGGSHGGSRPSCAQVLGFWGGLGRPPAPPAEPLLLLHPRVGFLDSGCKCGCLYIRVLWIF